VIVNAKDESQIPKAKAKQKVFAVPANDIALNTIGRPLGNTALIGAFAASTDELKLDTLLEVAQRRFQGKAQEGNIQAIRQGYEYIKNKI
jgi:pyruvate ferredoxin oxidoreductase gamma subunit